MGSESCAARTMPLGLVSAISSIHKCDVGARRRRFACPQRAGVGQPIERRCRVCREGSVERPPRRRRAACRAWRERAFDDAARRVSRRSAFFVARERVGDGARRRVEADWPRTMSCRALRRVARDVFPFAGGGSFTPARRAFERPIAIACFVLRAPCRPSRMWCISSRTNSPAWVDGALPSRASRRARSRVAFSGMVGRWSRVRPSSRLAAPIETGVQRTGSAGCETSFSASAERLALAPTAMSPSERMPISRLSRVMTGERRIWCLSMTRTASSIS